MKLTLSLILFFAATTAYSSGEPGVAMISCSGVRTPGDSSSATSFRVVMEQTNADEQDGAVLLNEKVYSETASPFDPIEFRIRIFRNVDPHLLEGEANHIVQAEHLMSNDIPSGAFREIADGTRAGISFQSLRIRWNFNENSQSYQSSISYRPSNKSQEFYDDSTTGAFQDIYCEPPFLKSQEQAAPTADTEVLSELDVEDNAEVEMN